MSHNIYGRAEALWWSRPILPNSQNWPSQDRGRTQAKKIKKN